MSIMQYNATFYKSRHSMNDVIHEVLWLLSYSSSVTQMRVELFVWKYGQAVTSHQKNTIHFLFVQEQGDFLTTQFYEYPYSLDSPEQRFCSNRARCYPRTQWYRWQEHGKGNMIQQKFSNVPFNAHHACF